jgi:hypothetical protein
MPMMIDGDAAGIQFIVQDLVLNALKLTEREGVKPTWEAGDRRIPGRKCRPVQARLSA